MPRARSLPSPPLTVPCPLCRHAYECPFAQQPRDECLDMWPLGRPGRREILGADSDQVHEMLNLIANNEELTRLLCDWEQGKLLADGQYLRLREIATAKYADGRHEGAALWAAMEMLRPIWARYVADALAHYPAQEMSKRSLAAITLQAFRGALVVCRDDIVAADIASPVRSSFERLFGMRSSTSCGGCSVVLWGRCLLMTGPSRMPLR